MIAGNFDRSTDPYLHPYLMDFAHEIRMRWMQMLAGSITSLKTRTCKLARMVLTCSCSCSRSFSSASTRLPISAVLCNNIHEYVEQPPNLTNHLLVTLRRLLLDTQFSPTTGSFKHYLKTNLFTLACMYNYTLLYKELAEDWQSCDGFRNLIRRNPTLFPSVLQDS